MITRRFEYVGGGSDKFWEVTYPDEAVDRGCQTWTCRWGRRGTTGQEKHFPEASMTRAIRNALDKITEKRNKGYVEVGGLPVIRVPITQTVPYINPRSGPRKPKPAPQPEQSFGPKRRKISL